MLVAVCRDPEGLELLRLISPESVLEAVEAIDSEGWTVQAVREVWHVAGVRGPLGGSTELYRAKSCTWSIAVDVDSDGLFGVSLDWHDCLGTLIGALAEARAECNGIPWEPTDDMPPLVGQPSASTMNCA